jgi:hypothetical protein
MKHWGPSLTISAKPAGAGAAISAVDSHGRTIWIADAHRDDGKRFVVHAEEKLSALWNLKRRFGVAVNLLDRLARFLANPAAIKRV